jgi:thiamine-phosphate pyrophosphorylase
MHFRFPSCLYPIADTLGDPQRSYVELAAAIVRGGAFLLQLRVKDRPTRELVQIARDVKTITDAAGVVLIINDRADIAALVDAAGVHVGQNDLPAETARSILGPDKIVGVSTHNLAQAEAAARSGAASYIAFGPIFATASKTNADPVQGIEALRQVRRIADLPIVAIGGITAATMAEVLDAGAEAVAMIGEIVKAPDVEAKVRSLLSRR